MAKPSPQIDAENRIECFEPGGMDGRAEDGCEDFAQLRLDRLVVGLQDRRAVAVDCGSDRDGQHLLEEADPALDQRMQPGFGRVAGKREGAHRRDLVAQDGVHFAVDPLHVGKEAEDRAPADAGAGGDRIGAGRQVAFADQFEHRLDDPPPAVRRATAAAIGVRRFLSGLHASSSFKPPAGGWSRVDASLRPCHYWPC